MKFKYLLIAAVINILSKKVRYWGELTLKGYKIIPHGQKLFKFGITLKEGTSAILKYIFTSTVPCNSSWMYCIKILCRFVVHFGYLTSIEPISYYPKDIKLRSILTFMYSLASSNTFTLVLLPSWIFTDQPLVFKVDCSLFVWLNLFSKPKIKFYFEEYNHFTIDSFPISNKLVFTLFGIHYTIFIWFNWVF